MRHYGIAAVALEMAIPIAMVIAVAVAILIVIVMEVVVVLAVVMSSQQTLSQREEKVVLIQFRRGFSPTTTPSS